MVYECCSKLLILTTPRQYSSSSEDSIWCTRRQIPYGYWKESFIIIFKRVGLWPPLKARYIEATLLHLFSLNPSKYHAPIWTYVHYSCSGAAAQLGSRRTRQTALNERWVRHRIYYPHNTLHAYETIIRALSGIRNFDPINRAAAELHSRPHGHRDRPSALFVKSEFNRPVSQVSKSASTSHFKHLSTYQKTGPNNGKRLVGPTFGVDPQNKKKEV